jgi:exodeoxyribonuclease V beta subunit
VPARRLDDLWGRSSYSSWTHAAGGEGDPAAEEGRDVADREPVAAADGEAPAAAGEEQERMARWPEQGPLGPFPRGPGPGDCLHRILERLDYRQPVAAAAGREIVERELRRAALGPLAPEPVLEGLERVRLTPLGGGLGAFRVADLDSGRRLNELRFDLTLGLVEAQALAAAFADHPGGDVDPAYPRSLAALPVACRGFLTGSIDLVFEAPDPAGGRRWWVLDWKSNWLGRRDAEGNPLACGPRHYGPAAMAELMVRNHYVLQAHLYLVALHRYLRWRRPGYRPEDHLGGYAYAFLRGAPGSAAEQALPGPVPGMVVEQPPLARILALDAALGPR